MTEAYISVITIQFYKKKTLLIYSLKMALRKQKYCSSYVPLINYTLHSKIMVDYKFKRRHDDVLRNVI